MKQKERFIITLFICLCTMAYAQNLQVETIADLDASGGVTIGPDGNIYVSDFGPFLNQSSSNTKVYKMEYGTWDVTEFATGFSGASGARFDSEGNFYQSNPSGGRVSKVSPLGIVTLNWATGMNVPIGITNDSEDNLYVCNCGNNTVRKVAPDGSSQLFASGSLFNCPNGITIDPDENLYVCNFSDGRIIKITADGTPSLFKTFPVYGGVGNGHLTYSNGFLYVALIGVGQIYKLSLDGVEELVAGVSQGFSNLDGQALDATFSKPNGIAASITGDTLWVNCSVPSWPSNSPGLHPGKVRMITGVCSLLDVECPLLTSSKEPTSVFENEYARLSIPHPNPVTSLSKISYEIFNSDQQIKIKLIDASQKLIAVLEEGRKFPGSYLINLEKKNLSAGAYFIILESNDFVLTQQVLIL